MQVLINIFLSVALNLLVGLSFSMCYFTTKHFNVLQAIIISFGAYFTYFFKVKFDFPFIFSIPLSMILSINVGLFSEILIFKPMRNLNSPNFSFLVASIGLYGVLQNCISLYFGDDTKIINTGEIEVGHQIFDGFITTIQIATVLISIFLFLSLYFLFNKTNLGIQIRAVSQNNELATIYGISSNKIILFSICIGSGLSAITGILYALDTNLTPTMGFNLLLYGIVAMIIGGVGSFRGLLFGSLLLATVQNLVAYYLDTKWMDAATYVILIGFLLWKPLGFSGKRLKKVEI